MKLSEIANILNCTILGDPDVEINKVSEIHSAKKGDITFIANPKYEKFFDTTNASAVIVGRNFTKRRDDVALLIVDDPYFAFVKVLKILNPAVDLLPPGIHPTAVVAESAILGENVRIGANAVIGERVKIGNNSVIMSCVVIGNDVEIGDDVLIYPNVTIYHKCKIGNRVIIHSGTVIGSDGFGFVPRPDGTYEKIPQIGIVVIEDDVEIGSNCSIDRATLGETVIKRGAKLDNLIQIAHNVVVGENTVIAAQTGIAGSTKIGKNCVLAGQVGIVGHIEIADRTTIAAQSGVSKSITEPGKVYFGYPAREHSLALRIEGAIRQLPELIKEFRELKARVEKFFSGE
ncbi:MAG: UDP-3-O-(3-hydroxymyristoyl)glucosamine N-acyltransferase [Candidatus Kryptonium sp.]